MLLGIVSRKWKPLSTLLALYSNPNRPMVRVVLLATAFPLESSTESWFYFVKQFPDEA